MYSFLGFLCEVAYCSILSKKLVNRGFLNGPICPIYGVGGLLIVICLQNVSNYPFLVFVAGFFLTSLVEYATSYIMEKAFNVCLWDYSNKKFNINGRVCLLNSFIFGILGLVLIYFFHPFFTYVVGLIPSGVVVTLAIALVILLVFDTFMAIINLLAFRGILQRYTIKLSRFNYDVSELYGKNDYDRFNNIKGSLESKFPHMKSPRNKLSFESIKEYLSKLKAKRDKE